MATFNTGFANATDTFNSAFANATDTFNNTFKLAVLIYLISMIIQNVDRINEKIGSLVKLTCDTLRWVWTLLSFPGLQGQTLGQA